jgi:hypothetical protein
MANKQKLYFYQIFAFFEGTPESGGGQRSSGMTPLEPTEELVAFGRIGCDSVLGARFDQEGPASSRATFWHD